MKLGKLSLLTSLIISFSLIGLRSLGVFENWELLLYDFYTRLKPAEKRDDRVLLVGLTEQDIAQLKTNRLSDWQLYQIIKYLEKGQPAVIGVDFIRDHPVPPNYWEIKELQAQGI